MIIRVLQFMSLAVSFLLLAFQQGCGPTASADQPVVLPDSGQTTEDGIPIPAAPQLPQGFPAPDGSGYYSLVPNEPMKAKTATMNSQELQDMLGGTLLVLGADDVTGAGVLDDPAIPMFLLAYLGVATYRVIPELALDPTLLIQDDLARYAPFIIAYAGLVDLTANPPVPDVNQWYEGELLTLQSITSIEDYSGHAAEGDRGAQRMKGYSAIAGFIGNGKGPRCFQDPNTGKVLLVWKEAMEKYVGIVFLWNKDMPARSTNMHVRNSEYNRWTTRSGYNEVPEGFTNPSCAAAGQTLMEILNKIFPGQWPPAIP